MAETGEFQVESIVKPEDVAIVKINFSMEIFHEMFSKLEMINAMEYLAEVEERLNIPSIFVNTAYEGNEFLSTRFAGYNRIKEGRRKKRTAPQSILDSGLKGDFERFLPGDGDRILESASGDLFNSGEFLKSLKALGKGTVFLTGFFTELEVARTSASSLENGFYGVTISDATSTYSERIYYEALDLISQSTEVIDTRDLMKIWP